MRRIVVTIALVAVAGCNDHPLERPPIEPTEAPRVEIPLSYERDVDLLFVVDDSNSMDEEQTRLSAQFKRLMFDLDTIDGGFPNAHIGVVSSDLGVGPFSVSSCLTPGGDRGCLEFRERVPGCEGPSGAPYIRVTNQDGVLSGNITDVARAVRDAAGVLADCDTTGGGDGLDACDVAEAFACIANLGTGGCGLEQHWEAARRALSPPNTVEGGCNGGFLRDGALLAVLVLADEDDCSAQNPDLFAPPGNSVTDPLGTYNFRCFEFGVACDQTIGRTPGQVLTGCHPIEDAGDGTWLHPPSTYSDFFRGLRPERKIIVAGIVAPFEPGDAVVVDADTAGGPSLAPTCDPGGGIETADPGIRHRAVVTAMGDDGIYGPDYGANICSDDYTPVLDLVHERIRRNITPGCLPSPLIDTGGDLIASADEAQCSLEEVRNYGDPDGTAESTLVPRCVFASPRPSDACPPLEQSPGAVQNPTCWFLCDSNALDTPCNGPGAACTSPACGWQIRFCRDERCDPLVPPPENTTAVAHCVTCNPRVPGCLCGDGVCDGDVQENAVSCEEDCG